MKKPIPFGKYYLLDRISVGGMAEVFKAKAFGVEGFERLIAVKRILPSIAEDEEFITMFIDEAKIAVQLQHANIAQIFDLGKVGDSFFIALEYVAGRDVRTIYDRMRTHGQSMPIPMAAYITMKMCEGLDYAHNKKDAAGRDLNLVHRDVSPQNILISYDGECKIIDFGIAKAAGKAGKTQAGILKGKFGYMSPEQVRGLPLDRRSDIFSVGICLWELVTGERLFVGESDFSTLEKVRNVEIAPPSTYNRRIPNDLEKIILKALSREVEDRYQSAMDLHDDLQSWMYTSGNFFARKDLAAFMNDVFRDELAAELASRDGAGEVIRSTVPPPPKAAPRLFSSRGPARPGAPPPPPKTSVPPPTPRSSRGSLLSGNAAPPSSGRPPLARPGGSGAPFEAKRTMMGMAAPQSGPPKAPVSVPPRLPNDLARGKVATPVSQNEHEPIGMDGWDDDEPPTNIYSKETAAEMAHAAIAHQKAKENKSPTSPPANLSRPPSDPIAEEEDSSIAPVGSAPPRSNGVSTMAIALMAIIAISAVTTVLFLLFKGEKPAQLTLDVEPSNALKIVVDGSRVLPGHLSPFILDLKPGPHNFTVQKPGYEEQHIQLKLAAGQTLSQKINLVQIQTGFFLETDPPGATVWIDDRPHEEKTPTTIRDLPAGEHSVRIAKGDSYAQKTIKVEVVDGEITKLPIKKLDLKSVKITFKTNPSGAEATLLVGISETEKKLGSTPIEATIDSENTYKIRYALSGYKTAMLPVEPPAGQADVELEPVQLAKAKESSHKEPEPDSNKATPRRQPRPSGTGMLSVQTRPWSKVYIDGRFIKNTPLVNHKLKAGTYRITVENPSYNIKKKYKATIKANKTTTLVKTLI